MEERERLIGQLGKAREAMRGALGEVDTGMEIYPEWTIKQVLAHIAGWDDAVTASLRAHAGGEEPGTPATEGIDAYNEASVATREALDYDQVVREWEWARNQLIAALNEMPAVKFDEPMLYPWGGRGSVVQGVQIFVDHEEEHAREIREIVVAQKA